MPEQPDAATATTTETTVTATETTQDTDQDATLGDAGKEAIRREREARKAAEKEAETLRAKEAERERKERKATEDEAKRKGEFEQLAARLESERDAALTDRDGLRAENDRLRAAIDATLTAEWKQLPTEVRDAYLGADDDPLAKLAFLPKGKALAAKLAERGDPVRGNGPNPRPNGKAGVPTVEQTIEEMRRARGIR